MSITDLRTAQACLKERLSCQELKVFYKLNIRSLLPPSFKIIENVDGLDVNKNSSASKIFEKTQFLISLLRSDLTKTSRLDSLSPWMGVYALITQFQPFNPF